MAEYEVLGIVNQPESLHVDSINDGEEERSNGVVRKVFGNSLIVELMCSYVSSEADLRNLRLVNHNFQRAATKIFRKVQKEIVLKTESRIRTLVELTKNHDALNLSPFPFTSFRVFIASSLLTLENFGKTVGPHITRYSFQLRSLLKTEHPGNTTRVVTLLTHSTQLVALEIFSFIELLLTKKDLDRFPSVFPHLSTLKISGTHSNSQLETDSVSVFPLLDLLVSRSPELKKIHIPPHNPSQSTRILRSLVQNRPKNLPHFSLDAYSNSSSFINEVMDMDLTFTDLIIPTFVMDDEHAETMIRRLCTWLETQTNNLINLSIDIFSYNHQVQGSFRFPELQVLKNLKLTFPEYFVIPYSRHVHSFVGNPFPSLRKLCLERYREEFASFEPCCTMPSVQELHLRNPRCSLSDPSWSIRFPNLITLHIEFDRKLAEAFRPMLSYILIHLTRLEHLDLDIVYSDELYCFKEPNSLWSSWDLLTGRASESYRELILSDQEFPDNNVGGAEEPANGIYTVPSLSNMKTLKCLRIFPRLKSNLDAIVYMSRKGLLRPLQKLILSSLLGDKGPRLTEFEKTAYKEVLLRVHKEVVLWK